MAAHILSPIASFNTYILETQLHPTYLPFAILPCVHAARVSLAYRGITSGARKAYKLQTGNDAIQPTWVQDLAGYLIMVRCDSVFTTFFDAGEQTDAYLPTRPGAVAFSPATSCTSFPYSSSASTPFSIT